MYKMKIGYTSKKISTTDMTSSRREPMWYKHKSKLNKGTTVLDNQQSLASPIHYNFIAPVLTSSDNLVEAIIECSFYQNHEDHIMS